MPQGKIRVLIADDHAMVRDGLVSILHYQKDFVIVGEAEDGAEAVARAAELKPDVVLMDLMMPAKDGADATLEIRRRLPDTRVLLLTTYGSSAKLSQAFENGATGAITKSQSKDELFAAIRDVAAGRRVVSAEIEQSMHEDASAPKLSARQSEILEHMARGLTNDDLAKTLGLTKSGIKFHILEILRKLNVSNRSEAVAVALRKHLLKG